MSFWLWFYPFPAWTYIITGAPCLCVIPYRDPTSCWELLFSLITETQPHEHKQIRSFLEPPCVSPTPSPHVPLPLPRDVPAVTVVIPNVMAVQVVSNLSIFQTMLRYPRLQLDSAFLGMTQWLGQTLHRLTLPPALPEMLAFPHLLSLGFVRLSDFP